MIVFVRVPKPIFWILCGFVAVSMIVNLCDPTNWRFVTPSRSVPTPVPVPPQTKAKNPDPSAPDPPRTDAVNAVPSAPEDEDARAALSVQVASNAEVWLDGHPTKQTGSSRLYQTPPLTRGEEYDYAVRARWMAGDRVVDTTRHVKIRAGGRTEVDFTRPDAEER